MKKKSELRNVFCHLSVMVEISQHIRNGMDGDWCLKRISKEKNIFLAFGKTNAKKARALAEKKWKELKAQEHDENEWGKDFSLKFSRPRLKFIEDLEF